MSKKSEFTLWRYCLAEIEYDSSYSGPYFYYGVIEAYLDKDGNITSWTDPYISISADSKEDVVWKLRSMLKDIDKPIFKLKAVPNTQENIEKGGKDYCFERRGD